MKQSREETERPERTRRAPRRVRHGISRCLAVYMEIKRVYSTDCIAQHSIMSQRSISSSASQPTSPLETLYTLHQSDNQRTTRTGKNGKVTSRYDTKIHTPHSTCAHLGTRIIAGPLPYPRAHGLPPNDESPQNQCPAVRSVSRKQSRCAEPAKTRLQRPLRCTVSCIGGGCRRVGGGSEDRAVQAQGLLQGCVWGQRRTGGRACKQGG
jgi:hypothetical protein